MTKNRDNCSETFLTTLCSIQYRRTVAILFIIIFGTSGALSKDVHSRQRRQTTCNARFLQISPSHTMCLPDFADRDRPLSATEKQNIVDDHNRYRINVSPQAANMMVMRWDENLAAVATKWAQQCLGGHEAEPVRRQIPEYFGTPIGQNVAQTDSSDALNNIKLWHDEVQFFQYGNPTGTGGNVIGHYTQIVNAYASKVGCGRAFCADGGAGSFIFVCNYARAQMVTEQGTPYCVLGDSTCPVCSSRTSQGLCDCGSPVCLNAGTLNLQSCTCTCGTLYSGNECQTLNCPANGAEESFCATNSPDFCTRFGNYPGFCPFTCNLCPLSPPCSLVCLNGGTLNNQPCLCRCPTGFSGDQCQISGTGNVNGGWSTWGSWNFNSVICPVTCGRTAQKPVTRRRTCTRPPPSGSGLNCPAGGDEQTVNQNCLLTNDCPVTVNGGWATWGAWNFNSVNCPVTCGRNALKSVTRFRTCTRPPPSVGGLDCSLISTEGSQQTVSQNCGLAIDCVGIVNGGWGTWGAWNFNTVNCPVTCGRDAVKPVTRSRSCTRPSPSGGGLDCPSGGNLETVNQNCGLTNTCPTLVTNILTGLSDVTVVVGDSPQFSAYVDRSDFTDVEWRVEDPVSFSLNQIPRYERDISQFQHILTIPNIQIFEAGVYSFNVPGSSSSASLTVIEKLTDQTISQGAQVLYRVQVQLDRTGAGQWFFNGQQIVPDPERYYIRSDPTQYILVIIAATAADEGQYSFRYNDGSTSSYLSVAGDPVVNGNWSTWGAWNTNIAPCPRTCGTDAQKEVSRTRTCTRPPPSGGGSPCSLTGGVEYGLKNCELTNPCPVHGGFGTWSNWVEISCSATCGVGLISTEEQTRACDRPSPAFGGSSCFGEPSRQRTGTCLLNPACPTPGVTGWATWKAWREECSALCGVNVPGSRIRFRDCLGQPCLGEPYVIEDVICDVPPCSVDGGWILWSQWSGAGCVFSCGNENRTLTRERTCTNPAPQGDGAPCQGAGQETKVESCGHSPCVVTEHLCQTAEVVDSVGYRYHVTDCNKYIQCYYNPNGNIMAAIRHCPFNHYWDQSSKQCMESQRVACPLEKCTRDNCLATYKMEGTCSGYWECTPRGSQAMCCPSGFVFVPGKGCRPNYYCEDLCPSPFICKDVCAKRPTWTGDSTSFDVSVGPLGWYATSCMSDSRFDLLQCGCKRQSKDLCVPSYTIAFDSTQLPAAVKTTSVNIGGGMATLSGESTFWIDEKLKVTVALQMRVREYASSTGKKVLVRSSNCGGEGSNFVLYIDDEGVHFELISMNEVLTMMVIPTMGMIRTEWKTITMTYNKNKMVGVVESGSIKYMSEIFVRGPALFQCGLWFGWDGYTNDTKFLGDLDLVNVYQCDPGDLY